VKVNDTVGAGDAFLAAFISALTSGAPAVEVLDFACAAGALVASRAGATPTYGLEEIRAIQNQEESRSGS
jgi:fructokinase